MLTVASFDLFETLLVRRVGRPSSVFPLLGTRARGLGWCSTPERFAAARLEAERCARRRIGPTSDPTLTAIYSEFAWAVGLSASTCDRFAAAELELEASLLVPNPLAVELLRRARDHGSRIAITSDTYLPSAFLAAQLQAHGMRESGDVLLVSCEAGATKRDGQLFTHLARMLKVQPEQIVHLGNDWRADVTGARRAGVRVRYRPEGNLTADERLLEDEGSETGSLASALAGAARLARLSTSADPSVDPMASVAADVAAPLLVGYVLWVLRRAEQRGIQRLYFLSREGQVLLEIAERLVDRLQLSVELRYLYASRQSLNLASLQPLTRPALAWVLTHAETNTLRTLLVRLGLEAESVGEVLTGLGFPEAVWDLVPTSTDRDRLFDAFVEGPLRQLVLAAVEKRRLEALAYLLQEGLLEDSRMGIVDLSGIGSQFHALSVLRQHEGLTPADGFLFLRGFDPYLAAEQGYSAIDQPPLTAYFDDELAATGQGAGGGLPQLLEMFCAADHGTVSHYAVREAGVEAVLTADDADHVLAWGLRRMRRTIEAVTDHLYLVDGLIDLDGDLRPAVRAVASRFWLQPSRQEAEIWGAHPFEGTSGSETPVEIGAPWTLRDLLAGIGRAQLASRYWYQWRSASLQRSAPPVRTVLQASRAMKNVPRQLMRQGSTRAMGSRRRR